MLAMRNAGAGKAQAAKKKTPACGAWEAWIGVGKEVAYFMRLMRLTISLANSRKALLPLAEGSNTTPGRP